jgi:aldose 1-epimerase
MRLIRRSLCASLVMLAATSCHLAPAPPELALRSHAERRTFGTMSDGREIAIYTLTNQHGMIAKATDYGASLTELWVPDRAGALANVVLGFDQLTPYLSVPCDVGATMGRVANRIGNARFTLDGKEYRVTANSGPNQLHGGLQGFDKRVWRSRIASDSSVAFTYTSADGEEGFPGTVEVTVTYTLTNANELRLDYRATADKPTPINFTNHSFFNLAGSGAILDHQLTAAAERSAPTDASLIPTGAIASVRGTPLDFTTPHRIGERIDQLRSTDGYDHFLVLDHPGDTVAVAVRVEEPKSGRVMEVRTIEPGFQFYSGNCFNGSITGTGGVVFVRRGGFAIETQNFNDAMNHPEFPQRILRPGATFTSTTVLRFTTTWSHN